MSRSTTLCELGSRLRNHQTAITQYLTPSHPTLYKLLSKYKLADLFTQRPDRYQNAKDLIEEISMRTDYHEFLACLEEDHDTHLGHKYIASILKGESFKDEEKKHKESHRILEKIDQKSAFIIESLDIKHLRSQLFSCKLLTSKEMEEMMNNSTTFQDKSKRFLTILKTKGPIAHYIFLHDCLAKVKKESTAVQELYTLLSETQAEPAEANKTETAPNDRKRKAIDCSQLFPPKKFKK